MALTSNPKPVRWFESQDIFGLVMLFHGVTPRDSMRLRQVSRTWRVRVEGADVLWKRLLDESWFLSGKGEGQSTTLPLGNVADQLEGSWYYLFHEYSKRTRFLSLKPSSTHAVRGCSHTEKKPTNQPTPSSLSIKDFKFTFECPLIAENLTRLDDFQRYCSVCKECVAVVSSIEELDHVVGQRGCVSLENLPDDDSEHKPRRHLFDPKASNKNDVLCLNSNPLNRELLTYLTRRTLARLTRLFPHQFREDMPRVRCDVDSDGSSTDDTSTEPKLKVNDLPKDDRGVWIPAFPSTHLRLLLVDFDEEVAASANPPTGSTKSQFWLQRCYDRTREQTTRSHLNFSSALAYTFVGPSLESSSPPGSNSPFTSLYLRWSKAAALHTVAISGSPSNPDAVHVPQGILAEAIHHVAALVDVVEFIGILLRVKRSGDELLFVEDDTPVPTGDRGENPSLSNHGTTIPWHLVKALRTGGTNECGIEDYTDELSEVQPLTIMIPTATPTCQAILRRRPFRLQRQSRANLCSDDNNSDDNNSGSTFSDSDDESDSFEFAEYEINGEDGKPPNSRCGLSNIVTPEVSDEDSDAGCRRPFWKRHHTRRAYSVAPRGCISYLTPKQRGAIARGNLVIEAPTENEPRSLQFLLPGPVVELLMEASRTCNDVARKLVVFHRQQMSHDGMGQSSMGGDDERSSASSGSGTGDGDYVNTALYMLGCDHVNQLRKSIHRLRQPIDFRREPLTFSPTPQDYNAVNSERWGVPEHYLDGFSQFSNYIEKSLTKQKRMGKMARK